MNIAIFGATSAIAHACARRWATTGARFALVVRDTARGDTLAADLTARGAADARVVRADFAADGSAVALVAALERDFGALDRVLVAQGVMPSQASLAADPDALATMVTINMTSVLAVALAAANAMRARGHGEIVVLGSVAGDRGRPSNYLYGSTKAALATACDGLAYDLAGTGVHVMLVKPGMVHSPMTAGLPDSPLFAEPDAIAVAIDRGLARHRRVAYAPAFWRVVMAVIRHAPRFVVRKL
ncbi:MAG: SDR family NAD(P)-dependent oxidoreductase [Proteobacteria bacterium]|nr:SDR family NAD(P)-dependent oxidoreductase [Pseudomonadota bacterium]